MESPEKDYLYFMIKLLLLWPLFGFFSYLDFLANVKAPEQRPSFTADPIGHLLIIVFSAVTGPIPHIMKMFREY